MEVRIRGRQVSGTLDFTALKEGDSLEKLELPKLRRISPSAKTQDTKNRPVPPPGNNPSVFGRTYLAPLFLRTRCPHCQKLYRIDTRDIRSSEPHFQCMVCESTFAFSYPPENPLHVKTRLLKASLLPSAPVAERRPLDVKACPKCNTLNAKGAKQCGHCNVIFSRLDGLPLDAKLGALPSLVKAWHDLMSDYDNLAKHMAFVHRCEDLQALPYALKKYRDLKEAQPQDQIAHEMLHRVLGQGFVRPANWISNNPAVRQMVSRIHWARLRKVAPWALAGLLILLGLTQPSLKNLGGIGASILFITFGLHLFFKGRIELSDFW